MGLRGAGGRRGVYSPTLFPLKDVFKECSIRQWSSHVCFWERIKASQGGSFPALSFSFLSTPLPGLMVHWSAGVDRGVCPLISKHFQGVYGENAMQYFFYYVEKITVVKNQAEPGCRLKRQMRQLDIVAVLLSSRGTVRGLFCFSQPKCHLSSLRGSHLRIRASWQVAVGEIVEDGWWAMPDWLSSAAPRSLISTTQG